MEFILRFTISILTLCMALQGCSKPDGPSAGAEQGKILRITVGPPQTIDQHLMTGRPGWNIVAALGEPLVKIDYQTMNLVPAVAESWSVSEDGLVLTFDIRKEAKWSNGDVLTAHDFVYSWRRSLSPALGNSYATDLYAIKNAKAFHSGELKSFDSVGVTALSEYVLEFRLEYLDPLFLRRLASDTTAPVNKGAVEAHGAIDDMANPWTRAGSHVGNGPFRLVEWELNRAIKTEKNPFYWNAKSVKLDGIHFDPAETDVLEERQFRAGKVDLTFVGRVPGEKLATYRRDKPDQIFSQAMYATYYYIFNTTKEPFSDVNVRRAFSYAIDRAQIGKNITKGNEPVAHALSPITADYSPPKINLHNPELARKFLADAGFPDGKGFPTVTLTYNTMDSHKKIAVALQQMWKKELNVDVQLENQEWKVFLSYRKNLEHQIARSGSSSNLLDPADFLDSWTTGHGMNTAGWSNSSFDGLIEKAARETNNKKRYQYLFEAEAILLDQLPVMPIFYYVDTYLKSPKVKGFEFNAASQPNFIPVDIIDEGEK